MKHGMAPASLRLSSRSPALPSRSPRAARRTALQPARALASAGAVRTPLNLYTCLGLAPRAPVGAADHAAAERSAHPPPAACELSDQALAARAQLLALAGSTLSSLSRRAAYDSALAAGAADIDVPLPSLPGALLLLLEAGDSAAALRLGSEALKARPSSFPPSARP